jgi:hypothetical protein
LTAGNVSLIALGGAGDSAANADAHHKHTSQESRCGHIECGSAPRLARPSSSPKTRTGSGPSAVPRIGGELSPTRKLPIAIRLPIGARSFAGVAPLSRGAPRASVVGPRGRHRISGLRG